MKRTLIAFSLAAASLAAQTPALQLLPFGPWTFCRAGIQPAFFCAGENYPATYEPFMLMVAAIAPDTTGFEYDIKGAALDGTLRHFRSVFTRSDGANGGMSMTVIYTGILHNVAITVHELPSGAVQTLTY